MSTKVVSFTPEHAKVDEDAELAVAIALGQSHAIVQLLLAAHGEGRIRVETADDTLDSGALGQALHSVDQELRKAREAYDSFMDQLAREAGHERSSR